MVGHTIYLLCEASTHMELNNFLFQITNHKAMKQSWSVIPVCSINQIEDAKKQMQKVMENK